MSRARWNGRVSGVIDMYVSVRVSMTDNLSPAQRSHPQDPRPLPRSSSCPRLQTDGLFSLVLFLPRCYPQAARRRRRRRTKWLTKGFNCLPGLLEPR